VGYVRDKKNKKGHTEFVRQFRRKTVDIGLYNRIILKWVLVK